MDAVKKKRNVKSKLPVGHDLKKVSISEAAKSIDDLFESVKKNRATASESSTNEEGTSSTKKSSKVKKTQEKRAKKSDFEEDDGGMEYFDDDDGDNVQHREEQSRTYGIIKSRYNSSQIVNPEAPLERIDPESGLPVYKAHILKVGDGGGTALCPFDCACCF
jgi:hypothetical protein